MVEKNFGSSPPAVAIVASPKAGAGDSRVRIEELQQQLRRQSVESKVFTDVSAAVAEVSGNQEGLSVVVAAGGDGTLNLVASKFPHGTPIVPMALGTENLLARHYGLTRGRGLPEMPRLVDSILAGRDHWIDAGEAYFPRASRQKQRRRKFLIMASVGFDAEVVRRVHLFRRGYIRRWSYAKPIVAALRSYQYPQIRIELDEAVEGQGPLTVAWAFVFNLPRYAAGLAIETEADETDGLLDVCGLTRPSHLQGLRYLAGVLGKRHQGWGDVVRRRSTRVRLTSERPVPVQLDGDYAGRLPMEIQIIPQAVRLRLPPEMKGFG